MNGACDSAKQGAGPWVDIDLSALCANYQMLQTKAAGAQMAAVVKCDAYGLGLEAVATALQTRKNCCAFFVAYAHEGAELRKIVGADATIYVLNGPTEQTLALFESACLTPVLNSLEQSQLWSQRFPSTPAALHVDTGINRLGAPMSAVESIAALKDLNIILVMSHLACASNPAHKKNLEQREKFLQIASHFSGAQLSLAASAGVMMDKNYHFDLVRPGVALYGGSPFDIDAPSLSPVVALRAPLLQLRALAPGESVGYGARFVAQRPAKIATVALGYGDGYLRSAEGRGAALIAGERAPIVGRISMDLITLDVTDLKNDVKSGDIATFFGDGVSLFEAATAAGTIPYELLTGLGGRVYRRYL